MTWKDILKNERPRPPMPKGYYEEQKRKENEEDRRQQELMSGNFSPPMPEKTRQMAGLNVPKRSEDQFTSLVRDRIVPEMKKLGKSPYRFTRNENPDIFYVIQGAMDDDNKGLVRAFNRIYQREAKISFEPNTAIIRFKGNL